MILYHASKRHFSVIKRNQATVADGHTVPLEELQNKIYLTPDLGFALAMAAGPNGITSLDDGQISFERSDEFNPGAIIYVYAVESNNLPSEKLEYVDENQYTFDADELTPESVSEYKAKDVFNYYKLTDFKPPHLREQKFS